MTGLEAIWVPMVAGAVVGGGTAAAKGGSFGDIAKGAGIGAGAGAVTGGVAQGAGSLLGGASGKVAQDVVQKTPSPVPQGLELGPTGTAPTNLSPFDQAQLSRMTAQVPDVLKNNADFSNAGAPGPAQPQQPATTQSASQWKPSDYINAASAATNVASQIAFRPETPMPQMTPMPAIFSGQGGDLMQQLGQLSQG